MDLPSVGTRPEIFSLTTLRGIASLWVVLYHFWNDFTILFPSASILSPFTSRGNYAVPLFFILSGYVLSLNYFSRFHQFHAQEYKDFLVRRLARIYPVHLFTLLVVLAMVIFSRYKGWQLDVSGYTLDTFIQNLLLVHTWVPQFSLNWNYPSWSISSEWFAYLCFPFWCFLIERSLASEQIKIFALAILIITAGILYSSDLPFKELLVVIPTFLSGMIIWKLKLQSSLILIKSIKFKYIPDLILLLAAVSLFIVPNLFLAPVLLLVFSVLIYVLGKLENNCSNLWKHDYLVYLGEVSYSIYMSHTLAQKILYKLLPAGNYTETSIFIKLGLCLTYVLVVILGSLGTYYLIEKPARIFFRRQLQKG